MSKNPEQLKGKALFDYIRATFPNPVSIRGPAAGYCVGGAFMKARGNLHSFPDQYDLAKALVAANPALCFVAACDYSREITVSNDLGQFKAAWDALRRALCQE